jgi:hypothetical protein
MFIITPEQNISVLFPWNHFTFTILPDPFKVTAACGKIPAGVHGFQGRAVIMFILN